MIWEARLTLRESLGGNKPDKEVFFGVKKIANIRKLKKDRGILTDSPEEDFLVDFYAVEYFTEKPNEEQIVNAKVRLKNKLVDSIMERQRTILEGYSKRINIVLEKEI